MTRRWPSTMLIECWISETEPSCTLYAVFSLPVFVFPHLCMQLLPILAAGGDIFILRDPICRIGSLAALTCGDDLQTQTDGDAIVDIPNFVWD